jgi:hypothetical protein
MPFYSSHLPDFARGRLVRTGYAPIRASARIIKPLEWEKAVNLSK